MITKEAYGLPVSVHVHCVARAFQGGKLATQAIQQRDRFVDRIAALKRLRIGTFATISGLIIHREAEDTFHIQHADEAMLGSVGSVVDWIEQLKREM